MRRKVIHHLQVHVPRCRDAYCPAMDQHKTLMLDGHGSIAPHPTCGHSHEFGVFFNNTFHLPNTDVVISCYPLSSSSRSSPPPRIYFR